MSVESYSNTSPYKNTDQTSWYLKEYDPREITPYDDDAYFTLTGLHHHRPDRLSQDIYGTPKFWWVFMVRNMDIIKDPIFDMKAGLTIRIPVIEDLS